MTTFICWGWTTKKQKGVGRGSTSRINAMATKRRRVCRAQDEISPLSEQLHRCASAQKPLNDTLCAAWRRLSVCVCMCVRVFDKVWLLLLSLNYHHETG